MFDTINNNNNNKMHTKQSQVKLLNNNKTVTEKLYVSPIKAEIGIGRASIKLTMT